MHIGKIWGRTFPLLQDKKKDIAKELISTEQGFIKKLTKEDIIGLFS